MKQPPTTATRVSHERLRTFIHDAVVAVGMPEAHADLLADLLVTNDLRGVLSHGSFQLHRYVREISTGGINPTPTIRTANETDNALLLDGDGGLGYFPGHEGTLAIVEKAKRHGIAILVTRNHGHIGAAGIYARLAAAEDLCAFVTSGVQLNLDPGAPVARAASNSPMAFATPAGDEPPLVLDCGVTGGLRRGLDVDAPGVVLRMIGFGTICQSWGGLLTGLPIDPSRSAHLSHEQRRDAYRYGGLPEGPGTHVAANQGAMVIAFDPKLFIDLNAFKREMDEFARRTRQLEPVTGTEGAYLPGHIEMEREPIYRRDGIPLRDRHQEAIEAVAEELDLPLPWD